MTSIPSPHVRVMRKLHFDSAIAEVKNFYTVLLQVLCDPSNAALSDETMAWAPPTQAFFTDAANSEKYPGINFRFTDSDRLSHLTSKITRGFRIRHGDDFLAYQRDLLTWLGVLYRVYIPLPVRASDCGFTKPEEIVTLTCIGIKFLAPRTSNHFFSCWVYICRYFSTNPTEPYFLPIRAPSCVLKDAALFSTAAGYGLGGVSGLAHDLQPKNMEMTIFSGASHPVPSYTALAAPADCKDLVVYPLEFLDGFVQEYVKTRAHDFDLDEHGDSFEPPATSELLGRRKAIRQQPTDKDKRRCIAAPAPFQFWRPPVFTTSDRDSVLVYGGGTGQSFQVLHFRDQYSCLFQRILTQRVLATDGRFWHSTNESCCRGLTELSTLHQIGMAVLCSPSSLTAIWFFFTVALDTIEAAYHSHCWTDVYWSYVAVLVRKYARVSLASSEEAPRQYCIATWRIFMAAFAAWMHLPIDTAASRAHVNRLFLLWMPYSHQVFSDIRSPTLKDSLDMIESVAMSSKCVIQLGVTLFVDVFQHFSIPLPEPRIIPVSTLLPENNPNPFGQYLWRVKRQNRQCQSMLSLPLPPPPPPS